jgi:chloride channel protein, CIC family
MSLKIIVLAIAYYYIIIIIMSKLLNESNKETVRTLLFWFFTAVLAGIIGTTVVYFFLTIYRIISEFLLSISFIPIFIYPIFGALLVGVVIYRIEPKSMGEGIPSYLESLNENNGRLSFKETIFKFWAALLTLSTFGNGGFIGPVGRVAAGVMSSIGKVLSGRYMKQSYIHLFTICGLSAAIGALLHSPVGAGIFAVEIIQKSDMKYKDLFPSILSSAFSVYFAKVLGLQPIIFFPGIHRAFDPQITGWLLLISVVSGLAGYGYIKLYETISRIWHRDHSHRNLIIVFKVLAGSFLAGFIAFLFNIDILGTSAGLFRGVFSFDINILYGNIPQVIPLVLAIILVMFLKAAANCFTIGSGLSAGFAGPAMLMGLLLGTVFIIIAGISPGTPEYYAFLAAGFAGMLSSTMNTPIATAVITLELFGFAYSLPAGIASIIGFQVNRSNTLYDFALRERKTEYE